MVPPCSDRISRVPPYSRINDLSTSTGLSPSLAALSIAFLFLITNHWPGPRSLATTNGVSVDVLSSGYLDVSVPQVCLVYLCIQYMIPHMRWVFPFGYLWIKGCSHLPTAFRSVLRPSSPLSAKASTKCPFALDYLLNSTPKKKSEVTFFLILEALFFDVILKIYKSVFDCVASLKKSPSYCFPHIFFAPVFFRSYF